MGQTNQSSFVFSFQRRLLLEEHYIYSCECVILSHWSPFLCCFVFASQSHFLFFILESFQHGLCSHKVSTWSQRCTRSHSYFPVVRLKSFIAWFFPCHALRNRIYCTHRVSTYAYFHNFHLLYMPDHSVFHGIELLCKNLLNCCVIPYGSMFICPFHCNYIISV